MSEQELIDKLTKAYGLISQLATATQIILTQLRNVEDRVATIEAQAAVKKAMGQP